MDIANALSNCNRTFSTQFSNLSSFRATQYTAPAERQDDVLCRDFLEAAGYYAARFRLSPTDADEYRQDLVASVLPAARRRYLEGTYSKVYAYQCARHHLSDLWRAQTRTRRREMLASDSILGEYTALVEEIVSPDPMPDVISEIRELWVRIEAMLTPGQRRFFVPRYRDDVSVEDLARQFNCTANEVHQELYKARARIRKLISETEIRTMLSPM